MKLKQLFFILTATIMIVSTTHSAIPKVNYDGSPLPSLAPMLDQINSAVVNISTFSKQQYYSNPLLNDKFFRHFFDLPEYQNRPRQEKQQQSAGSGVVVNAKKGLIMTNYHVIKNADEIHVSLTDGRSFEAETVGTDPELDIAILEIKASRLTDLNFADSDVLRVGDYVVAIGNPFGLGQTVTTGIVSAVGRSGLGIEGYENFIQTDASINPGNSGGALVNLRGELVGINTAIIAPSGGNVGIGFAIPIKMAEASMKQIIKHGEVRRGKIGIGIQDITPALRKAFDLKNGQQGVLVAQVAPNSPAQKAGIKSGDIIISVNGTITQTTGHLRSQIGVLEIGDEAQLFLIRNGNKLALSVVIGNDKAKLVASNIHYRLLEGISFSESPDRRGVIISSVKPSSPGAYSGLQAGDIVIGVNRHNVFDLKSLQRALKKNDKSVLLKIKRSGSVLYIVLS